MKFFSKILCTILLAAIMFTGCNPAATNGGTDTSSDGKTASADKDVPMGRYVQKIMTPTGVENAKLMQFNKKNDGTLILSMHEAETPRAFIREGEDWVEQDNKLIVEFLSKQNNTSRLKTFCDYDGNWWASFNDNDNKLRIYKIGKDGAVEISVPYIQKANDNGEGLTMATLQLSESGKVCFSILNQNVGSCWAIVDNKTNAVKEIQPPVPDYHPYIKGETLYSIDTESQTVNSYDINSGNRLDSFTTFIDEMQNYAVDDKSQLVYANMDGIHRSVPDGSVVQTVVDNRGFAYASPDGGQKLMLLPDKENTFWIASEESSALNVYYYVIDPTLPTAFDKQLYVWAMEESFTVRGAATMFSIQNPDCEVVLEFGKSKDAKAMTDEDIINNLNTRLLAGEAPDVLILDGLPIAALIEQGMLSPLENIVDEKDYYTNILNCYQKDGKSYAYPTAFKVPAIMSSGTKYGIDKIDTLEQLATLYKDKDAISNTAYLDVFASTYGAMSSHIFKDGKTLDEDALRDFLTQTKAMVDGQDITAEKPDYILSSGNAKGSIEVDAVPSILSFRQAENPCGTGILGSMPNGFLLFLAQKDVTVEPMPGNGFLPQFISSIPVDAANKKHAADFIKILLSEKTMQIASIDSAFPVSKQFAIEVLETLKQRVADTDGMVLMSDPFKFDWDGFIGKLETPSNPENFLRETVYEQANLLYTNRTDVDAAVAQIVKKTRLYFAEKQ